MENQDGKWESDVLLRQILRADKEARGKTEEAIARRAQTLSDLPAQKEAFRKAYEAQTEEMAQRTKDSARKGVSGQLERIAKERDAKLRKLDELADSHMAAWVEQICASILRG